MKRKYFCFLVFCLFIILGCRKPAYVEREGLLVSSSDSVYSGDYNLERTGIKDLVTAFEFMEPVTNLSVGKKEISYIERTYSIGVSKESKDSVIDKLGYRVRIRGIESYYTETNTNYNPLYKVWIVSIYQEWHITDVSIVSVIDTSSSPWPPLGGDGEPPNIDLHD